MKYDFAQNKVASEAGGTGVQERIGDASLPEREEDVANCFINSKERQLTEMSTPSSWRIRAAYTQASSDCDILTDPKRY